MMNRLKKYLPIWIRLVNIAFLLATLITSMHHRALAQVPSPRLYLPIVYQVQVLKISNVYEHASHYGPLAYINGEIVSNLALPVYNVKVKITVYDGADQITKILTSSTFLPVTFPGQTNGFRMSSGDSREAWRVEPEIVSWSLTSTQTYLSPTVIFTPTPVYEGSYSYAAGGVAATVINNTGVTLTKVLIAAWSIYEYIREPWSFEKLSPTLTLAPGESASFYHRFDTYADGYISTASMRVAAQGIATP